MLVYQRVYDVIWNPCPELPKNWNLTQAWILAYHPSATQDLSYKIGEAAM